MPTLNQIQVETATKSVTFSVDEGGFPAHIENYATINRPEIQMEIKFFDPDNNVVSTVTWPAPDPDPRPEIH